MKAIKYFSLGLMSAFALSACSDQFLQDKKNYDNVTADVYNYIEGANARLNDLYAWCMPQVGDLSEGTNYLSVSIGNADIAGSSTEEYTGFSNFVNPEIELTSMATANAVPDYFMGAHNNIQNSTYGRIRNINDFIQGVSESTLTEEQKGLMLGQAYFFRAWCYYNLVKWYGGVPIVTEILDPVAENYTERSTTRQTIDFIISDLDRSAKLLANKTMSGGWTGEDYGRVSTGTALALKGRVLLLWASPLFNRKNDQARWTTAYTLMKQELDSINRCGYGLFQSGKNVNGSDFAGQFLTSNVNPEAVMVALYNNIPGDGLDNQKNNSWERSIRPANTGGSGKRAGLALLELFPMADGKMPDLSRLSPTVHGERTYKDTYTKLERSQYTYDETAPFMNRDPRFYRTFAMPGFRWAYSGDATVRDSHNPSYNGGKDYVLWNYVWYVDLNDQGNPESGNSYGSDNLLGSKQGVYVRKKSDDADVNSSPLYLYVGADTKGAAPFYSAAPLIEIRYAEVLLNLAEAACGAGQMGEAVQYLQQIRARAGYTAANNYGLQANLAGDQAACMSAILYERQIELAYEGKRFDDMRRWMLFDGGANLPEGAPTSWQLTGWGGNTCTWLGFKPWNGQRRENVEFRTGNQFGVGTTQWDGDPLLKAGVERPDGVNFSQEDIRTQLTNLKTWYNTNLVTTYKVGDGRDSQHNPYYITFRPKYYLLGFSSGAQDHNKKLPQTIGWQDYNNGGAPGTFDPLAE
jgi:hypothetical protein